MKLDKDPDARLDYRFDFVDFLETGETITDQVVVASGCTVESFGTVDNGTAVVAWISGGTLGTVVHATCHITTSAGRQNDGTIILNITNL